MHSSHSSSLLGIDLQLIRRFGDYAADYRLYPESDYFVEAFDVHAYLAWLDNRKSGYFRRPLSLYVHIPFCHALCSYCNFHQIVAHDANSIDTYLHYLLHEIKLQGQLFKDDPKVEQVYFGGGTPTYLDDAQLSKIIAGIQQNFNLVNEGEFCIEVDPRQFQLRSMRALRDMGFNCAIIGVQDFDRQVQQSIQRLQSAEMTLHAIQSAQQAGFQSIRIELNYGLPKQDLQKFTHTLEQIIAVNPNRIKLRNYRHLPEKFKSQRGIDPTDLPNESVNFEMRLLAIVRLTEAGYAHIGMNLFAKLDDPLVHAQRQGRLHYGLQGYSIYPDCDHVALGLSGIGSIGPTLNQNYCDISQYYEKLEQNTLPIMRGLELNADDLIRRSVMHALICHSVISYESVEAFFPIDFKQYFATELAELRSYEQAGLIILDRDEIAVTPSGQLLINSICKVFDKYLRARQQRKNRLPLI